MATKKIYTLKPDGFDRLKRNLIMRGVVKGFIASGIGIGVQVATGTISLPVVALTVPIIVLALATGIRRGLKMRRDGWSSYRLVLADDFVVRQQANMPDIEVERGEITGLIKTKAGIDIKTRDRLRTISIPAALNGYDEVAAALCDWREFEDQSSRTRQHRWLLALVIVVECAALAAVLISKKVIIVLPSSIFVIATMVWGYLELRRSPNVDARFKKTARIYWIVVLFVVFRAILVMVT